MLDSSGTSASVSTVQPSVSGGSTGELVYVNLPTVLLIDDDPDSLVLLSYILDSFSCNIISESTGTAALERVRYERFDLVMLDIQLPEVSGLEIVRTLRSNPVNATLPIVAVTALARAQDRAEILRAGCDLYISKPYLVEDIESTVAQYIKRSS